MTGRMRNPVELLSSLDIDSQYVTQSTLVDSSARTDEALVSWFPTEYTWVSPVFHHKPLYFEQPNLERYGIGRSRWLQPVASGVHFFGTIGLVPYKAMTQHPAEKVYTLGNLRPGDCTPLQRRVWLGQSKFGETRWFWAKKSGYR